MAIITLPLPNIFSNGTTADANQVNANLNQITANVNANATDATVLITAAGAALVGAAAATNNVGATVQAQLTNVGSATGAAYVGYTPTGAGAVATKTSLKLAQIVSAIDYGADVTGVADSSAAFTAAFVVASYVYAPPPNAGAQYLVHDVIIPNGTCLSAYGSYFKDAIGAGFVFKLTGTTTKLLGAYINSAPNCSVAAVVVENGQRCTLTDVTVISAVNCFRIQATGGNSSNQTKMVNCYGDSFTGIGVYSGANCSELRAMNCYMDAGTIAGGGGQIPTPGTTGWEFDGTGSTVAFGGHALTQCQASNTQDGFYFKNAALTLLNCCVADGNSARGFAFDGNTTLCTMTGCFTGPAQVGIWAGGTTQSNWATGLTTINNGVIPPGGGTTYYTSATVGYNGFAIPSSICDIQLAATASFAIDAATWLASQGAAHVYLVAAGANLSITGAQTQFWSSGGTIGAATAFIGPTGQQAFDNQSTWVTPFSCVIQQFTAFCSAAPGAGQTYTYTLDVNAVPSALTGQIAGAATFGVNVVNGTQVSIAKGSQISLKVVGSAGAAAAYHNGYLMLIPQPS